MAIDKSGKWWKGATASDALRYLRALKPGGYTVDEVLPQKCECGSSSFLLYQLEDDELSYLVCTACKTRTFITDSQEYAGKQKFELLKCPCRQAQFRVYLGVHSIEEQSVANWMSLCVICEKCGVLGKPLDWEFDTDKSEASYAKHTKALRSRKKPKEPK